MKIRTKLLVLPFLISILSVLILSGLFIMSTQNKSEENLRKEQSQLVESITLFVNEFISKHKNVVTQLRENEYVRDTSQFDAIHPVYRGVSDQEYINVRDLFKTTRRIYPNFAYIETFTPDKALNVVLEPYEAQLDISEENFERGFSYRDWYSGAMTSKDTYISEAYISASIMKPVTAISSPIFNAEGEISGIMIGALELTELSDMVSQLSYGETGITYIIDKNGHLVAHPDQKYFNSNELFNTLNHSVTQTVLREGNASQSEIIYDDLTKQEVYLYFKKIDATDWYVISQQSVLEAHNYIQDIIQTSILYMFIVSIILGFVLYLNANSSVKSLTVLTNLAHQLHENDFSISNNDDFNLYIHRPDEIGALYSAFMKMMNELNVYHVGLEALIDQRTEQLQLTNDELLESNRLLEDSMHERLKAQEQLAQSEKMASLTHLVVGIAHEVNTPVGNCVTLVTYMDDLLHKLSEQVKENRLTKSGLIKLLDESDEFIHSLHRNLDIVTEDLKQFKSLNAYENMLVVNEVNLYDLLHNIAGTYETNMADCQIEIYCDNNISIVCDIFQLRNIMNELFENALHYAFVDSTNNLITIDVKQFDDAIQILFCDNGCGIDENLVSELFVPFFTTNRGPSHSGLGLNFVYNSITRLFDGTIRYIPRESNGMCYEIVLRDMKEDASI